MAVNFGDSSAELGTALAVLSARPLARVARRSLPLSPPSSAPFLDYVANGQDLHDLRLPRPERPSSHRLHQEVAQAPQSQPAPNGTHPLSPEAVAPGSPSHQRPHCPLRLHPPPPKPIPTLPPFSSPISTSNHLKSLSGHPNFSFPLYHSLSQALAFSQLDELTN